MKVIQIIGSSGSGKTTFIRKLAKQLTDIGKTGTIKHLGHHSFMLEEGKDTTLHYQSGVSAAIGIDDEKSVATIRCNGIEEGLALLSDLGMDFAVVEGFKSVHFPCIVIGDLESGSCIMRNPSVEEAISNLDGFSDYYTTGALLAMMEPGHDILTGKIILNNIDEKQEPNLSGISLSIESDVSKMAGVVQAKCRLFKKPFVENECELLIAISVTDIRDGPKILSDSLKNTEHLFLK